MKTREELTMNRLEQVTGGWLIMSKETGGADGSGKWPYAKEQSADRKIIIGNHWGPHWGE